MEDAGVRDILDVSSSSEASAIGSNVLGFDGVWKLAASTSFCFLADGVALLPPDSDKRSKSPRVFPSRWGVGPIAGLSGDGSSWACRCVLGLNSLRNVEGESYGSRFEGWIFAVRSLDGVAKSPLADLRGVASGLKVSAPVGEACFRFLAWLSISCWRFSRRARVASRDLSRLYSLYLAASSRKTSQQKSYRQ